MDAIVTAGGIPEPGEPLYPYTQGKNKAMLDICGKPMIQWVLDAVCAAPSVDRVVIVGLDANSGLACSKLVTYIPSEGGLLNNIYAGVRKVLEINPEAHHVLSVSSDIPGITPEMVDWTVNAAMQTDEDAYYNLITRQVMEARYPNSRRSYTKLRDVEVCGGDMNVLRTLTMTAKDDVWERIIAARKNALKQASLIGFDTLILVLLRLITLEKATQMICKRLNIKGRGMLCPYAEVGMDVDKPHQLEIMRADLANRVPA